MSPAIGRPTAGSTKSKVSNRTPVDVGHRLPALQTGDNAGRSATPNSLSAASAPPTQGEKCCPCVRYDVSHMSWIGQSPTFAVGRPFGRLTRLVPAAVERTGRGNARRRAGPPHGLFGGSRHNLRHQTTAATGETA